MSITPAEIRQCFEAAFPVARIEVCDFWPDAVPRRLGVSCAFQHEGEIWRKAVLLSRDAPDIEEGITSIREAIPIAAEKFGIQIRC